VTKKGKKMKKGETNEKVQKKKIEKKNEKKKWNALHSTLDVGDPLAY
jgi:hypothetical protein